MKKTLFFVMMVAGIMMLSNCGGGGPKQQQVKFEDAEDSAEVAQSFIRDKTIYGLCGPGTAMNTLEVLTDSGDTLHLSLATARDAGQVFGGLQSGDRLAVIANPGKTEATKVINLNTLLGDWVMPDPLDGSAEVGIRIKEGGVAESIEMTNIIYRTWKIYNGDLEIISVREGGGDEEELNLYEILVLNADSMAYKTIGRMRDEEETFEYTRWKPKPKVDLRGLELEESLDEFNKI
jgi:hypothetical protein